jgi:hypothetical protein
MTREYRLTYDDADTPRHYGFRGLFAIPRTLERHRRLANGEGEPAPGSLGGDQGQALAVELAPQVERAVAALDDRGRWLEDGMLNAATFIANVDLLARYLAARGGQVLPRLALLDR